MPKAKMGMRSLIMIAPPKGPNFSVEREPSLPPSSSLSKAPRPGKSEASSHPTSQRLRLRALVVACILGAVASLFLAEPPSASAGAAAASRGSTCTYTYTVWNTVLRKTSATQQVIKPRDTLNKEEVGPFGCTPCEEDQIEVNLQTGLKVKVCHRVAGNVARALNSAIDAGAKIRSLTGYRPSMSRGAADADGNRTLLSLHAFGVAVDVNAENNGLYDRCPQWGPSCRLIKGGAWTPTSPLSLTAAHPLVVQFKAVGFGWGGELEGMQKDFMHFSPTGG